MHVTQRDCLLHCINGMMIWQQRLPASAHCPLSSLIRPHRQWSVTLLIFWRGEPVGLPRRHREGEDRVLTCSFCKPLGQGWSGVT